ILAAVISIIYALISFFAGDKIVLTMSHAIPVTKESHQMLFNIVEEMKLASGLPMPNLYVIPSNAMNAFATGRDPEHASVAVTQGLLNKMNRDELTGVIAHEMSHIKNFDIRIMMISAVLVGLSVILSDIFLRMTFWGRNNDSGKGRLGLIMLVAGIILAILTPIIATIISRSIGRSREYLADASAAEMTRNPSGLASALNKLKNDSQVLDSASGATAHLFISNPLKNKKEFFSNLFSTHPPIEERIKKLQSM
ncbi:MAG: M48 family metallopeptidase, partial [Candidatus Diapherotrites archaeon]|nr:M48 family metallopeptidase [Candidatus Diapherotrites archaeon]